MNNLDIENKIKQIISQNNDDGIYQGFEQIKQGHLQKLIKDNELLSNKNYSLKISDFYQKIQFESKSFTDEEKQEFEVLLENLNNIIFRFINQYSENCQSFDGGFEF